MKFKERYKKLNERQLLAVEHIDGPLLVLAGPGSGKTELLGLRAANILEKTDTPPKNILNLTFTDAASLNMRERLIDLIGVDAYRVPISTFHSFCLDIIENYPEYFYQGADFNLADEAIKTKMVEDILTELEDEDPLKITHPEMGYVYLEDIKKAISLLKEEGIFPIEFKEILGKNKEDLEKINAHISSIFDERVNTRMISELRKIIPKIDKIREKFLMLHFYSLPFMVSESLKKVIETEETGKLSEWKQKWTRKGKDGRLLKDTFYMEKVESMSIIYKKYLEKMQREGYYDFSDMILNVIEVLEKNDALRYDLQEKYLYIQVDEFQDTSGIQMRLLDLMTKDEVHGMPNICVVGDDDQTIYRFQGAEISNILNFKEKYKDTEIITLVENYRSTQDILDVARSIILKGEERLEGILPEVRKDLISIQKGKRGEIIGKAFQTEEEEFSFVAKEVKKKLKDGIKPEEIVVIARTHNTLKKIFQYFKSLEISVFMDRRDNVMEKQHIREIVGIIRFAVFLLQGDRKKAEELLPDILSYSFWEIEKEKIWEISIKSYEENRPWMSYIKKEESLKKIGEFLLDLSVRAKNAPAEEIIDIIIGSKKGSMESPFKSFYFGREVLEKRKGEYLSLLSSLKCFVGAVREHQRGKMIKASDLLEFVDLHENNNIPVLDKNPLIIEEGAVFLSTAHGVKGSEFEVVFVLNCQEEVWGKKRKSEKLILPSNLPFQRNSEGYDDRLRLFYVSLTRAKKSLYLSFHRKRKDGKGFTPLEFIKEIDVDEDSCEINREAVSSFSDSFFFIPFSKKEKNLLFSVVKDYKLSATSFTKFLNVAEEGPQSFLEDSLLRFPRKKSLPLSYGTAVHNSIRELYMKLKKEGKLMKEKEFLSSFVEYLKKERLSESDFRRAKKRGEEALSLFYNKEKNFFSSDHLIERDFKNQGCQVAGIDITGKIDKIIKKEEGIMVSDFKTGSALTSWNEKGKYNKIKAWKYRNQLIFYKLLIETSRDFEKYKVFSGRLEFVEPSEKKEIISLDLEIKKEEAERVAFLIKEVGERIKNLQFPSFEKKETIEDIRKFEEDLLSKKI